MPNDIVGLLHTLFTNEDKPFVQRILKPENYPSLKLGKGMTGTHLMSWAEIDGKYVVFPTITMNKKNRLKRFKLEVALDNALNTGDFITFDNPEEADWFTKNYKQFWQLRNQIKGR